MRVDDLFEFLSGLGKCYVNYTFAPPHSFQQELQRECCFPRSRIALDEKQMSLW